MDCEAVKRRLLDERERLAHELEGLDRDLSESLEESSEESPYDQHLAEMATATLEREIDLTIFENTRAALTQVDRALYKLENGSYGRCDVCGGLIGEGRLATSPSATLCVECKRRAERSR